VNRRPIKDMAASVRQRLLNQARESDRPFNELLHYFAMERFLYRLSRSPYAEQFVLKGALMLRAWRSPFSRPTMDIDLLGCLSNEVERIVGVVQDICRLQVEDDGLTFDPESVEGERVAEEAEYEGVRVRLRGTLGTARLALQIDVGFGDAIVPGAVLTELPTLLDLPAPRIRGYSRESAIAEKFHTMVKRGVLNSRLRDFFDIWLLARQFDFEGSVLAKAMATTFARRGQAVPAQPVALTGTFAEDPAKASQWRGFLRKSRLTSAPSELDEVVEEIKGFLGPVAESVASSRPFEARWDAGGPWSPKAAG
jgi:hypothetical protein